MFKGIGGLWVELKLVWVGGDEGRRELGFSNMRYEVNGLDLGKVLMVGDGEGEEELVMVGGVEGGSGEVDVEVVWDEGGLVVDGNMVLIDGGREVGLGGDME